MLDRPNSKAAWLARAGALRPEGRAFIDGAYLSAASGETFARISPVDGCVFADVASGAAADIDHAVAAARRSFEAGVWRDAEPQHKKKVLLRFAELIREHTDEIASNIPVAREDIPRLLSTGEGEGSHLRALFGDVDLHTLLHLATLFDIDARSRLRARSGHSRRR